MKRLKRLNQLILILALFPVLVFSQASLDTVNLGTSANNRQGDNLRTAFGKYNEAVQYLQDSTRSVIYVTDTVPDTPTDATLNAATGTTAPVAFRKKDIYIVKGDTNTTPKVWIVLTDSTDWYYFSATKAN